VIAAGENSWRWMQAAFFSIHDRSTTANGVQRPPSPFVTEAGEKP
jgi:hypothetical protein